MTNETCGSCRFAYPRPENGEGALDCRFWPPVDSRFPSTSDRLWCGQYAAARPDAAARVETEARRIAPARNEEPAPETPPPAPAEPVADEAIETKLPKTRRKKS